METTTKVCSKCRVEKPFDDFSRHKSRKDGLQRQCKECYKKYNQENSERQKGRRKKWRQENADKKREQNKKWRQENSDKLREYRQENSEKRREYNKKWRQENLGSSSVFNKQWRQENAEKRREYMKKYQNERRSSDPIYKMICNLRVRISSYCKAIKANKTTRTKDMLCLDLAGFKSHIESKFQEGMSWENYGQWHVDHIKPLSLATTEQQVMELNHYTNLQPLWAVENLKKSNKYEEAH